MENSKSANDDLSTSKGDQAPVDPSNTSQIGQKVEQGVIDKKEGISEQSGEWEDKQENIAPNPLQSEKATEYLKNPSPESMDSGSQKL